MVSKVFSAALAATDNFDTSHTTGSARRTELLRPFPSTGSARRTELLSLFFQLLLGALALTS
jgi:hypothetical protein